MLLNGPKINMQWVTPILAVLVLIVSVVVKFWKPLSILQFIGLLANLEGSVFLATAFDPQIPPHGKGLWNSIKWAVSQFPKYGRPPAFDIVRFYIGLLLLIIGIVVSVISF